MKLLKREYLRGFINGGANSKEYSVESLDREYKIYFEANKISLRNLALPKALKASKKK